MKKFNIRNEFLNRYIPIRHSKEFGYVEYLKQQNQILSIGNVLIDIPQLILRRFKCVPSICIKKIRKNGKIRYKGSCCTECSRKVTLDEIIRIKKLFFLALKSNNKIPSMTIKRIKWLSAHIFFEQNNVHEYHLISKKNNACVLSEINTQGEIYCLVDRICSFLNLPRLYYKPVVCYMWPLRCRIIDANHYVLTVINKENIQFLGGTNFFPKCLTAPPKEAPPAYIGLKQQIVYILGLKFYKQLSKKSSKILKKYNLAK